MALDGDDLLATLAFLDDFEESAPSEFPVASQEDVSQEDALGPRDMAELSRILATSVQFLSTTVNQESPSMTRRQQPRPSVREPNQARNKRREELMLLRKQAEQLEMQLHKLQIKERIQNNNNAAAASCANCANNANATALATHNHQQDGHVERRRAWREIARNQGDRRVDAERENIRLKLLLSRQLQIAKCLQKHLDRATPSNNAVDRHFAASLTRSAPAPSRTDADTALVNSLLTGLEISYAELDAVFAACGLVDSPAAHVESRMRTSGRALELEIVGTKALPFDFDTVVQTAWDHYIHGIEHIPSRLYYSKAPKVFLRATDAYIKTHHVELTTKTTRADFGVKQVIRRFDDRDRVVIVFRSYIDPITFGHERLQDLSFLERGYIVIKKSASDTRAAAAEDQFTLVQACHVLTPIFSGRWATSNDTYPNLGAMVDFIMAVATANLRATQQAIEDELIQHAIASNRDI